MERYYKQTHDPAYYDSNSECLSFYYRGLKGEIERRTGEKGRILDVGCAGGWFLDLMEGWERHGCELSPQDFFIVNSKYPGAILPISFDEYPERQGYFDVITMQDVFDHMSEPRAALRKCFCLLRPGGLLVIKVHDISCLYAKATGHRFYAVLPPWHLFYYCKKSLQRILDSSGFQFTDSRHMGHILTLKMILTRLARYSTSSVYHLLAQRLHGTWLGNIRVYKNLHDIITVFAIRP